MLFCAVLFFAVGLVTSHHGGRPVPKWSPVYKVEATVYNRDAQLTEPITIWYDEPAGPLARTDFYGGFNRNYYVHNGKNGSFDLYLIQPITTEDKQNQMVCYLCKQEDMTMLLLRDLTKFKYIGTEKMFGVEAEKWQHFIDDSTSDLVRLTATMWVAYKNDHNGVKQAVPLRYEIKMIDLVRSIELFCEDHHYHSYDTRPIPSDVFKIDKNLTCTESERKTTEQHFDQFKRKHGRRYASEEEHELRLRIFRNNLRIIEAHNRAGHSFKLAVNHLADLTPEEINSMKGLSPVETPTGGRAFPYAPDEVERMSSELPDNWDWRLHGAVTPVKNQVFCASCWAFSAVGAVEGALKIHNKLPVQRLSEQALMDCSWGEENAGCGGGLPSYAFDWIKKHGLPKYVDYGGYLAINGLCLRDNVTDVVNISGWVQVPKDEKSLRLAIFKHGPISVAIQASEKFKFYSEGVFYDEKCTHELDHAVLAIGFGVQAGQQYWLVKNSWGTTWGDQGYILMAAKDNNCGIQDIATYVTFERIFGIDNISYF